MCRDLLSRHLCLIFVAKYVNDYILNLSFMSWVLFQVNTESKVSNVVWRGVCFETWVIYIWFRCAVWTSVPVVETLDIRHSVIGRRGFKPHRECIFFTKKSQFQSLHPQNIFSKSKHVFCFFPDILQQWRSEFYSAIM